MLKEGDRAPVVKLPDNTGKMISLDDFKGKKKIVYFYPKDDTPGCTKEACGFRDLHPALTDKNIAVLGVTVEIFMVGIAMCNVIVIVFVLDIIMGAVIV